MKADPVYRGTTEPLTYDWVHRDIPMDRPDLTDMEVAAQVRMLMRDQLDHERVCTLARDRIMALSKEVVRLREQVRELETSRGESRQVTRARHRQEAKGRRRDPHEHPADQAQREREYEYTELLDEAKKYRDA